MSIKSSKSLFCQFHAWAASITIFSYLCFVAEMVLNLSTQIGLNLTRPGQELDYSDMLDTSLSTGLQVHF